MLICIKGDVFKYILFYVYRKQYLRDYTEMQKGQSLMPNHIKTNSVCIFLGNIFLLISIRTFLVCNTKLRWPNLK